MVCCNFVSHKRRWRKHKTHFFFYCHSQPRKDIFLLFSPSGDALYSIMLTELDKGPRQSLRQRKQKEIFLLKLSENLGSQHFSPGMFEIWHCSCQRCTLLRTLGRPRFSLLWPCSICTSHLTFQLGQMIKQKRHKFRNPHSLAPKSVVFALRTCERETDRPRPRSRWKYWCQGKQLLSDGERAGKSFCSWFAK